MKIVAWLKDNLVPRRMVQVSFASLPANATFWFRGECYVKENDELVFLEEPMPRPFALNQIVDI